MKLINCPVNGLRPLSEFVFGGEFRSMPDAASCSDQEWAAYVHYRNGAPGTRKEWWYHIASGTWFVAERDTLSDEIKQTYLYSKPVDDQLSGQVPAQPISGATETAATTEAPAHAPQQDGKP